MRLFKCHGLFSPRMNLTTSCYEQSTKDIQDSKYSLSFMQFHLDGIFMHSLFYWINIPCFLFIVTFILFKHLEECTVQYFFFFFFFILDKSVKLLCDCLETYFVGISVNIWLLCVLQRSMWRVIRVDHLIQYYRETLDCTSCSVRLVARAVL